MSSRTPEDRIYFPVRGRQAYGARLLGTHPRTRFDREWCHRRQSLRGVRGLWVEIGPTPGWYETSTLAIAGYRLERAYWAYTGPTYGLEPVPAHRMPTAVTGPAPGSAGAWFGERCPCGAPVEWFDPAGWPQCEEHHAEPYQPATKRPKKRSTAA